MRRVLVYGDSNTHGTVPMATPDDMRRHPEPWPVHVARALPHLTLVVEGLPGRTTVHDDPIEGSYKNGLSVLPAILESHAPLEACVLMLGTNDLKARFAVTPEDIAASVERLGTRILADVPKLLIVAPPPIQEIGWLAGHFRGGVETSKRLAATYETVASRLGAGFLDAGAHIDVSPVDGVHFEADAHAILGAAVASMLAKLTD